MRAFVITGPQRAEIREFPTPEPGPGEVLVTVKLAGVCGTDEEFWTGHMAYLHNGHAAYPIRPGHEWMGKVVAVGAGVCEDWIGKRVTGDTMIGCGVCELCLGGTHHVCEERLELGIRGGIPGALAEQVVVPAAGLHEIPDSVTDMQAALVEPGANSLRAALACDPEPGKRVAIFGPGTIGLLAAMFLRARDVEVHLIGKNAASLEFARGLGFSASDAEGIPHEKYHAVIDATNGEGIPQQALTLVQSAGRLVCIGLAHVPTRIDTRDLVFGDITAVGILSGSPGLAGAIADYASGAVDPTPIVAATVGLEQVSAVLAGERPVGASSGGTGTGGTGTGDAATGPKILVNPQRSE